LEADVDLPTLTADAEKLQRTLVNLLGNAIKFTPFGGTVQFPCGLVPNLKPSCLASPDTGEGIPPEAFESIFDKFGQVESRNLGARCHRTGPDFLQNGG